MKNVFLFNLIFLILILNSCLNGEKTFEREAELVKYLREEHKYSIQNKDLYIFIFQVNMCGTCTDKTLQLLIKKYNDDQLKIVILSSNNEKVKNALSKLRNIYFFIDNDYILGKYVILLK